MAKLAREYDVDTKGVVDLLECAQGADTPELAAILAGDGLEDETGGENGGEVTEVGPQAAMGGSWAAAAAAATATANPTRSQDDDNSHHRARTMPVHVFTLSGRLPWDLRGGPSAFGVVSTTLTLRLRLLERGSRVVAS
ncbi:unnamed protein product [Tilletia controversa]|uniref:Uncharacterized protein n=3 Tax=Tilletia TaxID=13289 RepID=A0A8X7ML15_9BASI|nr:hypothetical protein CF328_g8245 [Tilletia controversa]KAE8183882.1 hypothetical protein CF335_g8190 [Tilletia laevis]KAE8248331.1 hypothetical protein A4X03_0g6808 [Tilletia caries]KAE8184695.1 hypothetical protein CF336_g7698 [Tilletia laevis]KAE8239742.1 hypothetical protein A4X06_0g8069 [Tilletia controversa]